MSERKKEPRKEDEVVSQSVSLFNHSFDRVSRERERERERCLFVRSSNQSF